MKVELLDAMGDDIAVVNAARVSFDKESDWHEWLTDPETDETVPTLSNKDTKLIHYLAKHHHWTPFSHCYAKFRIKAPLFVRSQLFKHKVGLTENEVSRRYVDSYPGFHIPDVWRKRAENVKQGSTNEPIGNQGLISNRYLEFLDVAQDLYEDMLSAGVCPEQARMCLPLSTHTEFIWSGSIAAFARVYQQRTSDHAQHETKQVALQIGEALEPLFPISWKALCDTSF